ncbi:MAG: hypothetical protein ACE14M_16665 [Terriglobales bacterium]
MQRVFHFVSVVRAEVCLLVVLGLACLSVAQQPGQRPAPGMHDHPTRLILKDGSYQPAVKYEIKGNRVRYLSAERYEWEEIPESLIDWAGTQKYAVDRMAGQVSPGVREIDKEAEAEHRAEEARSPQVAPGIRLPMQGGVFLLDVYQNQPQLAELMQNGGEINRNTGRNILRAAINPLAKAKQTIELKGAHARVQSHVTDPFIYINIEQDQDSAGSSPQQNKDRFRIVRMDVKRDRRIVGDIQVAIYGKVSQHQQVVPAKTEEVSGPWLKLTSSEPLPAGEYALVEMLGKDAKEINLYVWDFGVNPAAPSNPGVWKPVPVQSSPAELKSPDLSDRP